MRHGRPKPTPEQRRERLARAAQIEAQTIAQMQSDRASWERERAAATTAQQASAEEIEQLADARDAAIAQMQRMQIELNKAAAFIAPPIEQKAQGKKQADRAVMRVFNEILETI